MKRPLLEVIVESVEDALAAARGGADRLEIVRDLDRGGLTPPVALVREIVRRVPVPARAMVRVEEPYVPTSPAIVPQLEADARALAATGVEGIVVGVLDGEGHVDGRALIAILGAAPRQRATFHRAFEVVADTAAAFAALAVFPQVDTVLVNGGSGAWTVRQARLSALARAAPSGVRVLAAVGTDPEPLQSLDATWPFDVHVGRAAREPQEVFGRVAEHRVRALSQQLK